jgi:DnaJ-domain-containing protein 1
MSIGRRFLDLARTELNSLLEFAAKRTDGDDEGSDDSSFGLHGYSARELEEELERRRSARQEVEDAIHGRRTPTPPPRPAGGGTGSGGSRAAASSAGSEALRVQKAYAALEVAVGADFNTVRKAYRTLMRKYHPDHHTESPEKQRAANEVAQRLTESYKLLERKLRK